MLKKPEPGRHYGPPKKLLDDPEMRNSFPTLFLYLTQSRWDSGDARLTSTLTVFTDGECLTVILNDRHNNRSLFANESSLYSAMAAIEDHLLHDTGDWKTKRAGGTPTSQVPF